MNLLKNNWMHEIDQSVGSSAPTLTTEDDEASDPYDEIFEIEPTQPFLLPASQYDNNNNNMPVANDQIYSAKENDTVFSYQNIQVDDAFPYYHHPSSSFSLTANDYESYNAMSQDSHTFFS